MVVDSDGRIYVAGGAQLLRLLPDGQVDTSYQTNVLTGSVWALALQPGGKLLLGGALSKVGTNRVKRLARLKPDGTFDENFKPVMSAEVQCIIVDPDAKMLTIGGRFVTVNGVTRRSIARMDFAGTLNTTFQPTAISGEVFGLAPGTNGMVTAVGSLATSGWGGTRIARFFADGSLDTSYAPTANNIVVGIVSLADGSAVISSEFTTIDGVARSRIAKLQPNGSLDLGFNASLNAFTPFLSQSTDGTFVVSGEFSTVNGVKRSKVARLGADGSLIYGYDTYFNPTGSSVFCHALQLDGRVLVGGTFSRVSNIPRQYLARLHREPVLQPLIDGNDILLLWSASFIGFKLERTSNPEDAGSWEAVQESPGLNSTFPVPYFTLTNSISNTNCFYRLKQ